MHPLRHLTAAVLPKGTKRKKRTYRAHHVPDVALLCHKLTASATGVNIALGHGL